MNQPIAVDWKFKLVLKSDTEAAVMMKLPGERNWRRVGTFSLLEEEKRVYQRPEQYASWCWNFDSDTGNGASGSLAHGGEWS